MKRVDPLYNSGSTPMACACTCSVEFQNHSKGKGFSWFPIGDTCGCACNGTASNKTANKNQAKNV